MVHFPPFRHVEHERCGAETHPRRHTQLYTYMMYIYMYVRTHDGILRSRQKDAIRSPNKSSSPLLARVPHGAPIEDSPQATTTSMLVAIERDTLAPPYLRAFFSGIPPVLCMYLSTPLSISDLKLHAAACLGVMRFYEGQSGLRALDLRRSAFLFASRRQSLCRADARASRSNNGDQEARSERGTRE